MDASQYEAGFKDAVDKFYAATEAGADEVVHEESEEQTADYKAGIEAGFEFAQARMSRIGSDGIGSPKHDDKCCDEDEEAEGQGPEASKVKKQPKNGANETDNDDKKFEEPTFDPKNDKGSKKKRGSDNLNTSDTGVKETAPFEESDDEAHAELSGQKDDFGISKVGKAGPAGETDRGETGKGKETNRSEKATDGGAQEKDRASKGKASEEDRKKVGKGTDVQDAGGVEYKSLGTPKMGSGKAIKSPSVRVMKVGAKANFAESADFAELTARLEQLEAANAKLVTEKRNAEMRAHRMQLEEFSESLFATGRLTEAVIDQSDLVDYMEGLEYGTLEFAEGESAATKLMELLASLPAQVSFSEIAPVSSGDIPVENLDPHERALRLSKEEGLDYTEALKQTLFTAE
jgi:hypothetical protein